MTLVTDSRGARYVGGELPYTIVSAGSPSGGILASAARASASWRAGLARACRRCAAARPAAAAAFGGYASVPAAVAAAINRVPLLVHEQNAVFGRANRLTARFARTVALSFEPTAEVPVRPGLRRLLTGNPTRPEFAAPGGSAGGFGPLPRPRAGRQPGCAGVQRRRCRRLWPCCRPSCAPASISPSSAGPRIWTGSAPPMPALGCEVELASFFADVPARMAAADLLVSRSGASTVAELLALGRPSLLVPYLHAADDHQTANARALAEAGAAILVPQPELTRRAAGRRAGGPDART